MERLDLIQQLEMLNQSIRHADELYNDQIRRAEEERNERAWRTSEKEARWNEMLRKMENIRANIPARHKQENEASTVVDTSMLLEIIRQNHADRLDALVKAFEDSKAYTELQRKELLAVLGMKKRARR